MGLASALEMLNQAFCGEICNVKVRLSPVVAHQPPFPRPRDIFLTAWQSKTRRYTN
jgi:hypothetical protein